MPPREARARQRGFTLFELVVVILLIGTLMLIALDRIWPLRAEAERVGVQTTVGALRSALGLEVADRVVNGRYETLVQLQHSNPMQLLAQTPPNYIGERDSVQPEQLEPGQWVFDRRQGMLIYRLRFTDNFSSPLSGPARVRYRVLLRFHDKNANGKLDRPAESVAGLDLQAVEQAQWR